MAHTHTVFVYGSLLRGFGNHRLLAGPGAIFVGTGETKPAFGMVSLGAFPAVLDSGETAIRGELYLVDDETFAALDRLEGFPTFYTRRRILVDCADGEHIRGAVDAWIYILASKRYGFGSGDEIASGDWREYVDREEPSFARAADDDEEDVDEFDDDESFDDEFEFGEDDEEDDDESDPFFVDADGRGSVES